MFLRGGGSSMGEATTSTSGVRSPKGLSFLRESRSSKGKVLLWSLLRFCLLLAKLSLRLFGRRRRVRSRLVRNLICYKGLLIFSHVIFIDSSNLPIKEKIGRERGKTELSLCFRCQLAPGRRINGCLTSQLL